MHRLRIVLIVVACIMAGYLLTARPARGDTGGSAVTDPGGIDHEAEVDIADPGSSGSASECEYVLVPALDGEVVYDENTGQPIEVDGTGHWYEKWCDGVFFGTVYISTVDPAELLDQARRYLALPLPDPHLSPDGDQVVNLATWLWLESWEPLTSSVSVPGVTVTVTAVPETAIWAMGDGTTVVCDGPGTAYNPAEPDAEPECGHTYRRSSSNEPDLSYTLSVTVRWRASWTIVGAPGGGALGTIDRTTTLAVRVGEVQTVNRLEN